MNPLDAADFLCIRLEGDRQNMHSVLFMPKNAQLVIFQTKCGLLEKWAKSFNIQYSPFIAMFIGQEKIWTDSNASKVH